MPIYEYRCANGHTFEMFQRMDDPPAKKCVECGVRRVEKLLFPVAVHFKGSGFYSTDYGRSGGKGGKDGDSGSSDGKSDKKQSSGGDSSGSGSVSGDSGSGSSGSSSSSSGSGESTPGGSKKASSES